MIRDRRWLIWLLTLFIPIYSTTDLSVQAQLNQLASRLTKLESEVKSLKVHKNDFRKTILIYFW